VSIVKEIAKRLGIGIEELLGVNACSAVTYSAMDLGAADGMNGACKEPHHFGGTGTLTPSGSGSDCSSPNSN
jgi:hypothetical protein